jgi:hypothetical protein
MGVTRRGKTLLFIKRRKRNMNNAEKEVAVHLIAASEKLAVMPEMLPVQITLLKAMTEFIKIVSSEPVEKENP